MSEEAIIKDNKREQADEEEEEDVTAELPEKPTPQYKPIEKATTQASSSILDFGKGSNLFNQKEFTEIRETIHHIKDLLETERNNEKKLLSDLTELLERERAAKKTKETRLRTHLQKINSKVTDLSSQTVEKENQLKKEIDTLQVSIRAIQQNLSAFGLVAKPKTDQSQQAEVRPSLIDKKELEGIINTLAELKRLLDEEREREKQLEADLDGLVARREDAKRSKEERFREHMQGVSQRIAKITQQTIEKEAKLKQETGILQTSIKLIRDKLPVQDEATHPLQETKETEQAEQASESQFASSPAEEMVDFKVGAEDEEGGDEKRDKKRKFGKSFYVFGKGK